MAQVSKDNARYTPHGSKEEHCALCRHFETPNQCEKVRGLVTSGGWCRFFQRKG